MLSLDWVECKCRWTVDEIVLPLLECIIVGCLGQFTAGDMLDKLLFLLSFYCDLVNLCHRVSVSVTLTAPPVSDKK